MGVENREPHEGSVTALDAGAAPRFERLDLWCRTGQDDALGNDEGTGPEAGQGDPERHLEPGQHRRNRIACRPDDLDVQAVGVGGDAQSQRAEQSLVHGDPFGGDLQVRAAQRGEDRRVEDLGAQLVGDRHREVLVADQLIQRLEQGVVLPRRQQRLVAGEQVSGQTRHPQHIGRPDAEVGEDHPHQRHRQPIRRCAHDVASAAATSTFKPVSRSATCHSDLTAASLPGRTSGLRTGGPLVPNSGP